MQTEMESVIIMVHMDVDVVEEVVDADAADIGDKICAPHWRHSSSV